MTGYEIKQDNSNGYYWLFYASNGKVISRSSESYVRKADCENSINVQKTQGGASAPVADSTRSLASRGW
jgi:uncharacterized protein